MADIDIDIEESSPYNRVVHDWRTIRGNQRVEIKTKLEGRTNIKESRQSACRHCKFAWLCNVTLQCNSDPLNPLSRMIRQLRSPLLVNCDSTKRVV
jgi:hypothetical protein